MACPVKTKIQNFSPSVFGGKFKLIGTEYPLGFWFAQQGSIYVFVILIVVYVTVMNRIDKQFKSGKSQ